MNCKGCHANRCYKHILSTYSIHSSTALIAHLADGNSATWHRVHRDIRDEYAKEYPLLKTAIKHGMPYPQRHRLAYYASEFSANTPVNKATRLGFYDAVVLESQDVSSTTFHVLVSLFHRIVPAKRALYYRGLPHWLRPISNRSLPMRPALKVLTLTTSILYIRGSCRTLAHQPQERDH